MKGDTTDAKLLLVDEIVRRTFEWCIVTRPKRNRVLFISAPDIIFLHEACIWGLIDVPIYWGTMTLAMVGTRWFCLSAAPNCAGFPWSPEFQSEETQCYWLQLHCDRSVRNDKKAVRRSRRNTTMKEVERREYLIPNRDKTPRMTPYTSLLTLSAPPPARVLLCTYTYL